MNIFIGPKIIFNRFNRILVLVILTSAIFAYSQTINKIENVTFPNRVYDIYGNIVNIKKLAKKKKVVVVTLKATWCLTCQQQLIRIKKQIDKVESCGLSFIVLSPGPKKALQAIQKKLDFPYPFIEDINLQIASSLSLKMSKNEIFPSIFIKIIFRNN